LKVKIEKLKDSQILLRIEVEPERVNKALDEVYSSIQKRAYIPGFRAGKAPRDLLEKHYGKTASDEMVERLAWECYREIVAEKGIDTVGYPLIDNVELKKDQPLVFTVRVDVRPEFKLRSYKGIKVKEQDVKVTDEDIDNALKNIQESMAQYKNLERKSVASGDYIVCDYECLADGKSVDKNDKLWLYISDQLQPKELQAALVGAEQDIAKEVEITHPEDYQYKKLAGKKALYKITPKQIKEKILPEINDDLARGTGKFKDLQELKSHLRESILNSKKNEARRNLENQIFDTLLKNHAFEVPNSVVERQAHRLIEDAKNKLMYQGYKKEDLEKEDENMRKMVDANARNSVRLFFVLEKIAKEENIEAEDKEIEEKIAQIARSTGEPPETVKKKISEEHLTENLREQIIQDKVVEFLVNEAKKA
jgi:trigger factor